MMRSFTRYVWSSGFIAGFIVIAALGVFYPGDTWGKAIALTVSSAIVLVALAVRYVIDGRPDESHASRRSSVRLGNSEMPTDHELREGMVVGVLAGGEHQGRHFACGTSPPGESWLLVVSRWYPYRVKYSEDGLTPGFVRKQLREWDARVVRSPSYGELVARTYFTLD